ncbi:MAG: aminotransferase class I/II-fold pyridoxal phosphate-dependent enzyme [Rhodospirillales bacterium]|jgi:aspartate/methionine/tyrosine aminotransferase|nr:aminotransferase class I/II-fold pyridoxal phosphate-dependent enzyme [Rhodospirillales bacterium]
MTLKVAKRGNVPPFIVMDVMRAADEREAAGEDVLHLEVGQPGTSAPEAVIKAAELALREDNIGYTVALGIPKLRERISRHYQNFYGLTVSPDNIAVTGGSSCGFILAFLAAFDAGDRVALASPGYPAYRNILLGVGVEVIDIPVGPDTNFQPTPDELDSIEGEIDGLIIASPSNPAGTMISSNKLQYLVEHCRDRGIRLISDEIYHGLTYEQEATSALSFTNDAIIINSFSKYFSMTGWRLGWMIVPDALLRAVECLAQNLFISPPTLSQLAAVAAFDCTQEINNNINRYTDNRKLLLEELPKAGFNKLASADGGFYIYADISEMSEDSDDFCKRMLAETGVAATPGIDFDPTRGHRYVRFSFAGTTQDMAEAARRLNVWLK